MECVHTHQKILVIEGWGNPNCIQSAMQKIGQVSQKLGKIGQNVNQTLTPRPKHDRIWTW
jgi:hypothetical protein